MSGSAISVGVMRKYWAGLSDEEKGKFAAAFLPAFRDALIPLATVEQCQMAAEAALARMRRYGVMR